MFASGLRWSFIELFTVFRIYSVPGIAVCASWDCHDSLFLGFHIALMVVLHALSVVRSWCFCELQWSYVGFFMVLPWFFRISCVHFNEAFTAVVSWASVVLSWLDHVRFQGAFMEVHALPCDAFTVLSIIWAPKELS